MVKKILILGLLGWATASAQSLAGTSWQLTALSSNNLPIPLFTLKTPVTLVFATTTLSGFSGCNNYSANYQEANGTLILDGVMTTRKACAWDLESIERAYTSGLQNISSLLLNNEGLQIKAVSGEVLSFKALPSSPAPSSASFENTDWLLRNITPVSPIVGDVTFKLSNGRLSGFAGCNQIGGNYELKDNQIRFRSIISTQKLCSPEIMAVETALLRTLNNLSQFQFSSSSLQMSSTTGEVLLFGTYQSSVTPVVATLILSVASQKQDCTGVVPMKCLYVQRENSKQWELFYDNISGFNYSEGTEYTIEVEKTAVANPPADGSSYTYKLVRILNQKNTAPSKEVWIVAPQKQDCTGVAPMKCLLVQKSGSKQWEMIYSDIGGFNYIEGTEYTLEVEKTVVANPPADGSAVQYRLSRVISQSAVLPVASNTAWVYYIGPQLQPCDLNAQKQCFAAKLAPEDEWGLLGSAIRGFDYQAGYTYILELNASGDELLLLRVVSKTP